VLKQWRGTQRYEVIYRTDEDALTRAIIELASEYGRYGTLRPHSALGYRPPAPATLAPQFAALRSPTAPCAPQIAQRDFLMYPFSQPLVQKLGPVTADLTGVFCTSGRERISLWRNAGLPTKRYKPEQIVTLLR
jgi:hypothetical protein